MAWAVRTAPQGQIRSSQVKQGQNQRQQGPDAAPKPIITSPPGRTQSHASGLRGDRTQSPSLHHSICTLPVVGSDAGHAANCIVNYFDKLTEQVDIYLVG
jgi:hypothetical protein